MSYFGYQGIHSSNHPAAFAPIYGWRIYHDGTTWWAERGPDDEPLAASSWLEAAQYASSNPRFSSSTHQTER